MKKLSYNYYIEENSETLEDNRLNVNKRSNYFYKLNYLFIKIIF